MLRLQIPLGYVSRVGPVGEPGVCELAEEGAGADAEEGEADEVGAEVVDFFEDFGDGGEEEVEVGVDEGDVGGE